MKLREFNKLREWYKFIIVSGDNNNNKKMQKLFFM